VHDVDGRLDLFGQLSRSGRRLSLDLGGTGRGVLDDAAVARGQRRLLAGRDGGASLGVDGDESTVATGGPQHVDDHVVVDLQRVRIGHVELERGDPLLDTGGHLGLAWPVDEGHVEAVVDRGSLGSGPPGGQRVERGLTSPGGHVLDHRRRPTDRTRGGAGGEVVAHGHRPDLEMEVGVGVDPTRHHQPPRGVDDLLTPIGLEVGADLRDVPVGADADAGITVAVDVDDPTAGDQHAATPSRRAALGCAAWTKRARQPLSMTCTTTRRRSTARCSPGRGSARHRASWRPKSCPAGSGPTSSSPSPGAD
jgi:hypothetical protein